MTIRGGKEGEEETKILVKVREKIQKTERRKK